MAETFGLDASSRFTMLSGIAHDPIQRDSELRVFALFRARSRCSSVVFFRSVFTPLFLGAQLHIPTAEDIGTPGRLAEWMADSEITITHLTPGPCLSPSTREIEADAAPPYSHGPAPLGAGDAPDPVAPQRVLRRRHPHQA